MVENTNNVFTMVNENGKRQLCPFCEKICFSQKGAATIAHSCKGKKTFQTMPFRSYFCKYCRTWHLSSHRYIEKRTMAKRMKIINFDADFFEYRKNVDL